MAVRVVDLVTPLIEEKASQLGLDIVEIEYAKKVNGYNLTIYIDKEGGVTINDCEALHLAIDQPLDQLNPTNDVSYTLNVSSSGIDRPLKTIRDYTRGIGREVEVKFYAPYEGKKVYEGFIDSVDKQYLNIRDYSNIILSLPIDKIAAVLPIIKF